MTEAATTQTQQHTYTCRLPSFEELMAGSPTYRESYQIVALLGILDKLTAIQHCLQEMANPILASGS